jgi:hypothetical protein
MFSVALSNKTRAIVLIHSYDDPQIIKSLLTPLKGRYSLQHT